MVGGSTYTANSGSGFVIAGQTLNSGGSISLNLGPSAAVLALTTNPAGNTVVAVNGALPTPPPIIVAGQTYAGNTNGGYVVGGQTLTFGGSINLNLGGSSASVVALTTNAVGATVVAINGVLPTPPAIALGGQTLAGNTAGAYVVSGQTLAPGGSITLDSGASQTVVALTTNAGGATVVAVNGVTSTLQPNSPAPAITLGGQTLTGNNGGAYVVGDQTLTPGGSVTLGSGSSTTVVALTTNAAGATVVGVNGISSTIPFSSSPPITLGGQTLSGSNAGAYVVEGKTVTPGGSVTLGSGSLTTVVALTTDASGNTVVAVGSTTSTIPKSTGKDTTTNGGQGTTASSMSSSAAAAGIRTSSNGMMSNGVIAVCLAMLLGVLVPGVMLV